MSDDSDDKLIRPVFGSSTKLKERARFCQHTQLVVDEDVRTIQCDSCGAVLDPFWLYLQYAKKERRLRHLPAEISEAESKLDELKAEERKVKARMKTASRKDADGAVAEERARNEQRLAWVLDGAREVHELGAKLRRLLRDPRLEPRPRRTKRPVEP